jgi:hypothetical protein
MPNKEASTNTMTGTSGDVLSTHVAADGGKKALIVDLSLYAVLHTITVESQATLSRGMA